VATFNIHSGRNQQGVFDLDRTAAVLKKDFDVVALHEVRGGGLLKEKNQAQLLGEKLNMQWLFAPTERQWWHDAFGNGALANVPVVDWRYSAMPGSMGRGKRNLVGLRLMISGHRVNVLMTHIDRGHDRQRQLKMVADVFLEAPAPVMVMGDFNSAADDPQIQRIRSSAGVKDMGGAIPPENIDWIFVRGLEVVRGGIEKNDASDHPLVWAELKLPDTPKNK
jgi:endonuclease/exonuclease/phosphatase family metal-dependent hydrolase